LPGKYAGVVALCFRFESLARLFVQVGHHVPDYLRNAGLRFKRLHHRPPSRGVYFGYQGRPAGHWVVLDFGRGEGVDFERRRIGPNKRVWATKYKRLYFLLQVRTRLIDGTEHGLLHTPRSILATMKISLKDRPDHIRYRKKDLMEIPNLNPRYLEWMMGYPDGWTKLEDSETP